MGLLELYYGIPSVLKEAEKVDKAFRGTYLAVIFWNCYMIAGLTSGVFTVLVAIYDKPALLSVMYHNQPHTFNTDLYIILNSLWVDIALIILLLLFLKNIAHRFSELSGGCDIP